MDNSRVAIKILIYIACIFNYGHSYHYHNSIDTLNTIRDAIASQKKGMYLRFGDGELNILNGSGHSGHQCFHPRLQLELRKAYSINAPHVFKTVPLFHPDFGGYEKGMLPGKFLCPSEFCKHYLDIAKKFWGGPLENIYSQIALSYLATDQLNECLDFLLFLKRSNCVLFVGNRFIPNHIKTLLFGKNCKFIPTLERDAYKHINIIERECLRILKTDHSYKVVITCMGVSGKALQYRLYKKCDNVFLFDFGSLMDALCKIWEKTPLTIQRAWIEISAFNAEQFLEKFKKLDSSK